MSNCPRGMKMGPNGVCTSNSYARGGQLNPSTDWHFGSQCTDCIASCHNEGSHCGGCTPYHQGDPCHCTMVPHNEPPHMIQYCCGYDAGHCGQQCSGMCSFGYGGGYHDWGGAGTGRHQRGGKIRRRRRRRRR